MTRVICDITMSLDGFVAGPDQTLEEPLGKGGEQLHEWSVKLASFRERHGGEAGETSADDEVMRESLALQGAIVMGRRMFSSGEGPWEDDPNADGWWGDDPPFRVPVFVLTHHARQPVAKENGTTYTFVTDGFEAAIDQARAAAGDKDAFLAGGATVVQQALQANVLDELQVHVAPLLLGGGVRLFDGVPPGRLRLDRVVDSPAVTHLRYRRA